MFRDVFPSDIRPRQKHPSSADRLLCGERRDDSFGPEFLGNQVHRQAVAGEPLGGGEADRAQLRSGKGPDVSPALEQGGHERVHRVRAREDDPVERASRGCRETQRVVGPRVVRFG